MQLKAVYTVHNRLVAAKISLKASSLVFQILVAQLFYNLPYLYVRQLIRSTKVKMFFSHQLFKIDG